MFFLFFPNYHISEKYSAKTLISSTCTNISSQLGLMSWKQGQMKLLCIPSPSRRLSAGMEPLPAHCIILLWHFSAAIILATESPFAWEVPHKIMVRLTHLDACCIDWGGGKGGNWNLYGDSSWSALASDLNCLRTLLGSAMCWSFLRCTRHWVSETNHSSFPSLPDSLQSANVQKKTP